MFEDILLKVRKPARYLGNEWNISPKDFNKANVRFCLIFPDIYEVGMSNLGFRILYGLLNSIEDVSCERVFSPSSDFEQILRRQALGVFSLESKKNLNEFDIIGFSLGYELAYTNVLNLLDLSGIPFKSALRDDRYPLIIAGGTCALNPEPMADFIDLFVIGEAEEVILEIINVYRNLKQAAGGKRPCKKEILAQLKYIKGIYIPHLYNVSYNRDGTIKEFFTNTKEAPPKIKKCFLDDFEHSFYPTRWLIPYTEIIHDRITLEVMRGCPNKCRFCQARVSYFPYRYRSPQRLIDLAKDLYRATGYEDISLMGLSISDYLKIKELFDGLIEIFKEKRVGISLSSMKTNEAINYLLPLITKIKKTGLTFAPEAATPRLRKIISKDFDIATFFSVIEEAFKRGYQHIKLYFMIGLPQENNEDLDSIIDLSIAVSELKRKIDRRPARVNLSISTLIPKPHTPFQWLAMPDLKNIQKKQAYLKSNTRINQRIKLSFHNPYMSFLECLLSRGDRRLSGVILNAWQIGARFDGGDENFSFDYWIEALKRNNINPEFYISRQYDTDEILPWDFIDTGISKERLLSELKESGL
jgi:radical SAM family uncharacterized protein